MLESSMQSRKRVSFMGLYCIEEGSQDKAEEQKPPKLDRVPTSNTSTNPICRSRYTGTYFSSEKMKMVLMAKEPDFFELVEDSWSKFTIYFSIYRIFTPVLLYLPATIFQFFVSSFVIWMCIGGVFYTRFSFCRNRPKKGEEMVTL